MITIQQAIKNRVSVNEKTGCWIWQAGIRDKKYPYFYHDNKPVMARRASFEVFIGEINDPKITVESDCGHKLCVAPDHLSLGAQHTRLEKRHARARAMTHCKYGHTLADATIDRKGVRRCVHCYEEKKAKNKAEYVSRSKKNRTHCKYGHSYHDAYINKNGARNCRTCVKLSTNKRRKKNATR